MTDQQQVHHRYIVLGRARNEYAPYGRWGAGASHAEAHANFRKAGGRKVRAVEQFTAELPFAPPDREAKEDEADCYVDRAGCLCWIRCERHTLETV